MKFLPFWIEWVVMVERLSKSRFLLRAGLISCFFAFVTGAQQPSSPSLKVNVREVLVPVVVTDKSGHYVTDLAVSDFQIFEDGTPQKIVAFRNSVEPAAPALSEEAKNSSQRSKAVTSSPALSAVLNSSPKRTYLVCVDTLHSAFGNFARIRAALKRFFEDEQPGDSQYALIALGWTPHVIVDSTRDPAAILTAIGSKTFLKTIQDSEASNIDTASHQFLELMKLYCGHCACVNTLQATSTDLPDCPAYRAQVQLFLFSFGERASSQNQNFLDQLKRLIAAMSSMPTTRTVVFLSDGFNRFPGREMDGILKGFGPQDRRFEFNPRDLQPQLDDVLKLAVRYDVRFYTLDSRGLYGSADVPGTAEDASFGGARPFGVHTQGMFIAREEGDAMAQLARETGGLFFEDTIC